MLMNLCKTNNKQRRHPNDFVSDITDAISIRLISDITLTIPGRKLPNKKEKEMNNDFKTHYLWGFKDGLNFGIEKGMELYEYFNGEYNCPNTNTTMVMVESMPTETSTETVPTSSE